MSHHLLHRLFLVVLRCVLAAGLLFASSPANADTAPPPADPAAATWTVVPANSEGPDGRVSLRHVLDPGAVVEDAIAVQNLGSAPAEFTVATGDGVVGADGAFDIGEVRDAGAWISIGGLTESTIQVAAGETKVLPITIAIPADATPGDHPAGIVIGQSSASGGSVLTHRVGVRVHLQVAGELIPKLTTKVISTSFQASANPLSPGTLTVEYTVANPGNTRYAAEPTLTISGLGGIGQRMVAGDRIELLPAATHTATISVSTWPVGFTSGVLTASAMRIGQDSAPLPSLASTEFRVATISWPVVALVGLLTMVSTVLIVRRVRRRTAVGHREAMTKQQHLSRDNV